MSDDHKQLIHLWTDEAERQRAMSTLMHTLEAYSVSYTERRNVFEESKQANEHSCRFHGDGREYVLLLGVEVQPELDLHVGGAYVHGTERWTLQADGEAVWHSSSGYRVRCVIERVR